MINKAEGRRQNRPYRKEVNNMADYNYKGYRPYGAREMYCIDCQFSEISPKGNLTKKLIENGRAGFKIFNEKEAQLVIIYGERKYGLDFVKI